MCLAVPAKVTAINEKTAVIDVLGAESRASLELLEDVKVGDYIVVHAGCAIAKVDEEEAKETIALFREIGELGQKESCTQSFGSTLNNENYRKEEKNE